MSAEKIAQLRGRLEGVRDASGELATARELETALAELQRVITDMNGMVREANHSAFRLLGVPALHLLRKPLAMFIAEADRALFRSRLARALLEPRKIAEAFSVNLKLVQPSGAVEMQVRCLPESAGQATSMMCFLRLME